MNAVDADAPEPFAAHLGIDVAKSSLQASLLLVGRDSKEQEHRRRFDNDADGLARLSSWLTEHVPLSAAGRSLVHACLEATGPYGDAVARHLHAAGHRVSVVNPRQIKAYADSRLARNKTDAADASLIALFCRTQGPPAWAPPDPALEELQALCRHVESLQATRQQYQNRLEAETSTLVRDSLAALVGHLDEQTEQAKQQIQDWIDSHPDLKRQQELLASIPGVGELTAARLLSEVQGLRRFDSARQAAAYAGLTPQQRQSGSSIRGRTRLSKTGNGRVRKALYFPAMVAIRFNPTVRAMAQRLKERGKAPLVVIGAAMRKLMHLAYGVLKSGLPYDQDRAAAQAAAA